jgi:hypothetical protein
MLVQDALWLSPARNHVAEFMVYEKVRPVTQIVLTIPPIMIINLDAHVTAPKSVAGGRPTSDICRPTHIMCQQANLGLINFTTAMVFRPHALKIVLMATAHNTAQQTIEQQQCR